MRWTTERTAGQELDFAVAEAIGWQYRLADGPEGEILGLECWHTPEGNQHSGYPPQFSTDLNAAIAAAEQMWKKFWIKRLEVDKYEAIAFSNQDNGLSRFDRQPTPALAICGIILDEKEYGFNSGNLDAMGGLEPTERK